MPIGEANPTTYFPVTFTFGQSGAFQPYFWRAPRASCTARGSRRRSESSTIEYTSRPEPVWRVKSSCQMVSWIPIRRSRLPSTRPRIDACISAGQRMRARRSRGISSQPDHHLRIGTRKDTGRFPARV